MINPCFGRPFFPVEDTFQTNIQDTHVSRATDTILWYYTMHCVETSFLFHCFKSALNITLVTSSWLDSRSPCLAVCVVVFVSSILAFFSSSFSHFSRQERRPSENADKDEDEITSWLYFLVFQLYFSSLFFHNTLTSSSFLSFPSLMCNSLWSFFLSFSFRSLWSRLNEKTLKHIYLLYAKHTFNLDLFFLHVLFLRFRCQIKATANLLLSCFFSSLSWLTIYWTTLFKLYTFSCTCCYTRKIYEC